MKRFIWCVLLLFLLGCNRRTDHVNPGDIDTYSDADDEDIDATPLHNDSTNVSDETARTDSDTQTDNDSDGVANSLDNCAEMKNPDQADMDGDGIGNACDNCVTYGNASQADTDSNGVGDACQNKQRVDPDSDGIEEGDNCPEVANHSQEDADSDGIGNSCDNCVDVTNPFQEDMDEDGEGDYCEPALELPATTPICAAGSTESVRIASNLYILLDASSSMSGENWDTVTTALDRVSDEIAAEFNVGLGVYPAILDLEAESTVGGVFSAIIEYVGDIFDDDSLPIELLTMQSERDGKVIRDAYANMEPTGISTPTATALNKVRQKRLFDTTDDALLEQRTKAVILITDGAPDDLGNAASAAEALAEDGVTVWVIGIKGVNEEAMETLAVAGGGNNPNDTDRSWFPADDVNSLIEALQAIAGATMGCTLSIASLATTPSDWRRATVVVQLSPQESRVLTFDEYTLRNQTPSSVTLTENICAELKSAASAGEKVAVEVRVACAEQCGDQEICGDGLDNNCNDMVDENCDQSCVCIPGNNNCGGDCPAECVPTEEICDGEDNNCDGVVDEGCCIAETEVCDDKDNDCDGIIDEGCCIPDTESCDSEDNDCDGIIDEGCFVIVE